MVKQWAVAPELIYGLMPASNDLDSSHPGGIREQNSDVGKQNS